MSQPNTAIIVGAGHRAITYASYAQRHPEQLQIVGVADPTPLRREQTAARFGLKPDQCHASAAALAERPQQADFIINGTMDHQHVQTALPLLRRGYDMLLEKPFATSEDDLWELVATVRQHQCKVAICHVLRHAPFYAAIRQHVADGPSVASSIYKPSNTFPTTIWPSDSSAANGAGSTTVSRRC